jgi:hypothetical protein
MYPSLLAQTETLNEFPSSPGYLATKFTSESYVAIDLVKKCESFFTICELKSATDALFAIAVNTVFVTNWIDPLVTVVRAALLVESVICVALTTLLIVAPIEIELPVAETTAMPVAKLAVELTLTVAEPATTFAIVTIGDVPIVFAARETFKLLP